MIITNNDIVGAISEGIKVPASFTFNCPHCEQHLEAESDMVGMELNCPTCGQLIRVPESPAVITEKESSILAQPIATVAPTPMMQTIEKGEEEAIATFPIITVVSSTGRNASTSAHDAAILQKVGSFLSKRIFVPVLAIGLGLIFGSILAIRLRSTYIPSLSANQEIYNMIAYLAEGGIAADDAISMLRQYDFSQLGRETKTMVEQNLVIWGNISELENEEKSIRASRGQRIEEIGGSGAWAGASAGWQAAEMIDSVSEEGVGVLGHLLFAAIGAAAQQERQKQQMAERIDSEIAKIGAQRKSFAKEIEACMVRYRHSSEFHSFKQKCVYSSHLVDNEWHQAEEKSVSSSRSDKQAIHLMRLLKVGYQGISRFRIPEIIEPPAYSLGKDGIEKMFRENPDDFDEIRRILLDGINTYLVAWPKSRLRNPQMESDLKLIKIWLGKQRRGSFEK